MDTALYFPYIRVPQTQWFTQVLLYWDRAASIVPESVQVSVDAQDSYMRDLAKEELLEYIHPDRELYQRSDAFDRAFLELLGPRQVSEDQVTFTMLHIDKMSGRLFEELRSRGLAKYDRGPEWEAWWQIEVTTAGLYMAYLASAISGVRSEGDTSRTLPVTDQERAIGTLAADSTYLKVQLGRLRHAADSADLTSQLARLRYAAITDALPAPRGPVPAVKLKAFKEENYDKLRRCRIYLDDKLADLATLADLEQRKVKSARIMQELEDEVKSLQEQMNKKRWPGVAVGGFGGVMGGALATVAPLAAGGTTLTAGLGVGAGVLATVSAAYAAVQLMQSPRYDPRAPLAYAALAARL
jgi:hypothetical protein